MSEHESFAEQFEAYLDGTLPEPLRAEMEQRIANDPKLQAEVELDRRINASLRARFGTPEPAALPEPAGTDPGAGGAATGGTGAGGAAAGGATSATEPGRSFWRSRRGMATLAIVASVAWALFLYQLLPRQKIVPPFEPEPLAVLYQQAVQSGFEPYWECPPERFAATFENRQGVPLRMTDMPEDRGMLGLSYPGGLSRTTTAILCQVEGEPVMVFVDRVSNDRVQRPPSSTSGVQIFRRELGPLVLYEVSEFGQPQMLDYLALAD